MIQNALKPLALGLRVPLSCGEALQNSGLADAPSSIRRPATFTTGWPDAPASGRLGLAPIAPWRVSCRSRRRPRESSSFQPWPWPN